MKGLGIIMGKYFSRYLITTAKHAVKTEPIKYPGKYRHICPILSCAKEPTIPCENKTQLCVKAAEKPAFLRIFKKATEKLRIFLDLRKTCVFL